VTDLAAPKLTARGAATRARIVEAAADLMYVRGVHATTLDDVRIASGTSKSQLYQHFSDKTALVGEVIAFQSKTVLAREERQLRRLDSFAGLERWRDALVGRNALRDGAYGCVLGSMSIELSDESESARSALAETFARWEQLIADGLRRMQAAGTLVADADAAELAVGVMGALQGGYLLARTAHDVRPMKISLDMALSSIEALLVSPKNRSVRRPS
jgi:TetR/AcrR family transcriptional repressor of nem operon